MESEILRIDALASGGEGIGRSREGRVVFVPWTAPGDRIRVRIAEQKRRWARGRMEELLEPGPDRVDPPCPAFGSCGGCTWQHLDYSAQLRAKTDILREALRRVGGFDPPPPVAFTASPAPYGYRGRARLRVKAGRLGYRQRRSQRLCPVSRCPVLVPELEARLAALAAGAPPPDGELELAWAGDRVRVTTLGPGPSGPGERLFLDVAGERVGFSGGVFSQSNALLLAPLVEAVAAAAGAGSFALELFAGAGLFTLPLARRFERLVALEAESAAVADLRANLREAGLERVEVWPQRVEAAQPALEGLRPEVVVLDPPRGGLPEAVLDGLARRGAGRWVYLSCAPATLARDLARLREHGYRLERVEGFDLFPQTPHVEALAVLEAPAGSGCARGGGQG